MRVNRDKLRELMDSSCDGNYNAFGKMLDIDPGQMHRFLTKGIGGGMKIGISIMRYCRDNGLNVYEFFILD